MADLNFLIIENLALVLGLLTLLVLVLCVLVALQYLRLGRAVGAYKRLVGSGEPGSLGEVLDRQVAEAERTADRLSEIEALLELVERRSRASLQRVGMVRFNPFDDTGSDQSFAIALLDDRSDGIVISSLHGRSNTRLFAKPVAGGGSRHTLSTEEAEAIRLALDGAPPPASG